jgi:hypothetical protein
MDGPGASPSSGSDEVEAASCGSDGGLPHQAADLEALLPSSVANRNLSRWSLRGRCWLEVLAGRSPEEVEALLALFETPGDPHRIVAEHLAYGVAGRADPDVDPPYIVFGAVRPHDRDEITATTVLMLQGAGYEDVGDGADLRNYEVATIAGRSIHVGSIDMLKQDDHQRGRPHLYQTDDHMFIVVTDDEAWAEDAISQLP